MTCIKTIKPKDKTGQSLRATLAMAQNPHLTKDPKNK
jgi:hypothetical protein